MADLAHCGWRSGDDMKVGSGSLVGSDRKKELRGSKGVAMKRKWRVM